MNEWKIHLENYLPLSFKIIHSSKKAPSTTRALHPLKIQITATIAFATSKGLEMYDLKTFAHLRTLDAGYPEQP